MSKKQESKTTQPTSLLTDIEDLVGGVDETAPVIKVGTLVMYHSNNPNEDGVLSHPAIVTKLNPNGSVSLQIFLESHIMPMQKIPFAKEPQSGYYTVS